MEGDVTIINKTHSKIFICTSLSLH